ncbi:hypothetical protein ACJX0J_009127, partial [Zea mays]
ILTILAKDINVGSIFYKIIKFKKLASQKVGLGGGYVCGYSSHGPWRDDIFHA